MPPRRILAVLVFTLPLATVIFAVLAGAALLADALQDAWGGTVLRWAAAVVLIVAVADLVVLTTLLGLRSLDPPPRDE